MEENLMLKQINDRKSIRAFTDQQISDEDQLKILTAATQAPTAGNQQLYTIINITDQEKKDALADSCDHQPFIGKAKMVLVFCADPLKWYDAYAYYGCAPRPLGEGDLILAICDTMAAAQNAVTAAWSLGIGSCYIGDILENREIQKDILCLPDQVVPAAMVVFGYPTEQQKVRKKPERADLRYIVHENMYHRLDSAELKSMLRHSIGDEPFEEHLKAFCHRKYNSAFSIEMTRSVRKYLEEFHPFAMGH